MAKITFIGAGSIVFAKNLLVDILLYPGLSGSTITLMDIDPVRLEMISKLAAKVVRQEGFEAVIESTTDRWKALKCADYVILMVQIGGLNAYKIDIEIPYKYGIKQAVGDTLGPGGVFRGLRTIPVFLEICKDMQELCPDALLMNYVNPMALNCWAINKAGGVKNVGLCHSVQGTSEEIARYIGAPLDEISYKCAGINHMAWYLEYKWNGRDAYPLIKEKYNDPAVYNQDVTKFEFLKYFGYFVTESSYHMSEYVPYFRKKDEWIDKIKNIDSWLKEDNGLYFERCIRLAKTINEDMDGLVNSNKVEIIKSNEYGAGIINAIETGKPAVINGNVKNKGYITNLPEGCVVEVPCLVDKNGIQPTFIGDLPPQLAALNRTNINVQELAAEGALTGCKEAIYQAVMMDPLTSAVMTLPEISGMVTEMFEAEKQWLPQFK